MKSITKDKTIKSVTIYSRVRFGAFAQRKHNCIIYILYRFHLNIVCIYSTYIQLEEWWPMYMYATYRTYRYLKRRYMSVPRATIKLTSLFKYKCNSQEHYATLTCIRALQILYNEPNALAKALFYKLALPSYVTVISMRAKTIFVSQE